MKTSPNYLRVETKRITDAAFPFYLRKAAFIMANCLRPIGPEAFFKGLREAKNAGDVYIVKQLNGRHEVTGYLVYDITEFFKVMLLRYSVQRIVEGLVNPEIYEDWRPDPNFKLTPGEPDYIKEDCSLLV